MEALAVNSNWAGEAGRLVSSHYDQSGPTPLFARACSSRVDTQKFKFGSDGTIQSQSAADNRCVAVPGCRRAARSHSSSGSGNSSNRTYTNTDENDRPNANSGPSTISSATSAGHVVQSANGGAMEPLTVASGNGGLTVAECDGSTSQQWLFSATANATQVLSGDSNHTTCWEISGCNTDQGASVDTDYKCKALPKPGWSKKNRCVANMAWNFNHVGASTPNRASGSLFGAALSLSFHKRTHKHVVPNDNRPQSWSHPLHFPARWSSPRNSVRRRYTFN
jgi:hypothetical protein